MQQLHCPTRALYLHSANHVRRSFFSVAPNQPSINPPPSLRRPKDIPVRSLQSGRAPVAPLARIHRLVHIGRDPIRIVPFLLPLRLTTPKQLAVTQPITRRCSRLLLRGIGTTVISWHQGSERHRVPSPEANISTTTPATIELCILTKTGEIY